jgi:hypothetical protein
VTASEAMARLRSAAKVTPEFEGSDVPGEMADRIEALIREYPGIASYRDYLQLLGATGGVGADNERFDLLLYGLGGYVVPAFDEGYFLDRDRYFLFGELMRLDEADQDPIFLAFDTNSGRDRVMYLLEEGGDYIVFADSFSELVGKLAAGELPGRERAERE